MLGIEASERGQKFYEEAANRLRELVENKSVVLEKDVDDKDRYGRLLRHIFLDNENINIRLVKEGLANVYVVSPNIKYENKLRKAWDECLQNNLNMCKKTDATGTDVCDNKCIGIKYFHWDAEGNDCNNLNDEYVTFVNICNYSCDMTDWTVKDEANHIFTFPAFTLDNEKTVTIYTGFGTNTGTELYWRSSGKSCNAIWNNNKDALYLRNADGSLIFDYPYKR